MQNSLHNLICFPDLNAIYNSEPTCEKPTPNQKLLKFDFSFNVNVGYSLLSEERRLQVQKMIDFFSEESEDLRLRLWRIWRSNRRTADTQSYAESPDGTCKENNDDWSELNYPETLDYISRANKWWIIEIIRSCNCTCEVNWQEWLTRNIEMHWYSKLTTCSNTVVCTGGKYWRKLIVTTNICNSYATISLMKKSFSW